MFYEPDVPYMTMTVWTEDGLSQSTYTGSVTESLIEVFTMKTLGSVWADIDDSVLQVMFWKQE